LKSRVSDQSGAQRFGRGVFPHESSLVSKKGKGLDESQSRRGDSDYFRRRQEKSLDLLSQALWHHEALSGFAQVAAQANAVAVAAGKRGVIQFHVKVTDTANEHGILLTNSVLNSVILARRSVIE
jgi:hypothetical protein